MRAGVQPPPDSSSAPAAMRALSSIASITLPEAADLVRLCLHLVRAYERQYATTQVDQGRRGHHPQYLTHKGIEEQGLSLPGRAHGSGSSADKDRKSKPALIQNRFFDIVSQGHAFCNLSGHIWH